MPLSSAYWERNQNENSGIPDKKKQRLPWNSKMIGLLKSHCNRGVNFPGISSTPIPTSMPIPQKPWRLLRSSMPSSELDERKVQVAQLLVKKFTESGMGIIHQDPEFDKYTFEHEAQVDCKSRMHIFRAICCTFPFALLRQDVEEGIIRWEFVRPYLIAHGEDGDCVHLDRETYKCTINAHRTVPCWGFDCRDNEKWKVWLDYEKKVINPEFMDKIGFKEKLNLLASGK
jgi:Fe-S-cluster containining protein